jgi:hypothetical protein
MIMKKTLLLAIFFAFSLHGKSQNMFITSVLPTTVSGGININLQTATGNGAGYLSNSHTVTGNVIELHVCYWFNDTLPYLTFENNFFIPLENPANYTIIVNIILSSSTTVCNNFSTPDTETIQYNFLSNPDFSFNNSVKLYPNPSSGMINFQGLDAKVNRVEVYDVSGKTVKTQLNFSGNSLDLGNLQNGMYFVNLQTDKGVLNKKILVRR